MGYDSQYIIYDRIFWIYFIVTLFFITIGLYLIFSTNRPNLLGISVLWILGNVLLMIIVYKIIISCSPLDSSESPICFIDPKGYCFERNNRSWLYINVLFIAMLIVSTLWAEELSNPESGPLGGMAGVLLLLGGLLLYHLSKKLITSSEVYVPFIMTVIYLVIWFVLTVYVVVN